MGTISEAIELTERDRGRWLAHADPDHQSITGMFGGWTTAVALASVMNSSTSEAVPAAVTINFVGSIDPGSEVEISTSLIGSTRSLEHWSATVHSGGAVHAAALVDLHALSVVRGHPDVRSVGGDGTRAGEQRAGGHTSAKAAGCRGIPSGRTAEEETQLALANQAVNHFVDPADIAALAVFLAGPHGRSISGQSFPIDGDSKAAQ